MQRIKSMLCSGSRSRAGLTQSSHRSPPSESWQSARDSRGGVEETDDESCVALEVDSYTPDYLCALTGFKLMDSFTVLLAPENKRVLRSSLW